MKRKVEKVFKALNKKGMVRAFIETDQKEYVYPLITPKKSGSALRKIFILLLGMMMLLVVGMIFFSLLVKNNPEETVSQRISPDRQDRYGLTLLHHAVIRSDMKSITNLIENGAGIDTQDNYGWTPLHWAVFRQDENICRYLLQTGASSTLLTTHAWFKFPTGISAGEMAKITKNKAILGILTPGNRKNKQ